jgi:hypothetical protein
MQNIDPFEETTNIAASEILKSLFVLFGCLILFVALVGFATWLL